MTRRAFSRALGWHRAFSRALGLPSAFSRALVRSRAALTLAVLCAHLLLLAWALPAGWGAAGADERPRRITVDFVRELAPATPPPVAALRSLRSPRAPRAAQPALGPAVALAELGAADGGTLPELAELAELAELDELAELQPAAPPEPDVSAASAAASAAATALAAADAAAAAASAPAVAFEWPPSTRLSYVLTGNYRGPVDGRAQVEWLRQGSRYQVHLDLGIGPPFANLVSRRISSSGLITPQGLYPKRYDEETRVALRAPRQLHIVLDEQQVKLPSGRVLPRPAGVQDSASQFVQMTWLFTLQPALLQAGRQLVLPLALPRVVEDWTYEVVGPETLSTPMGALQTVHVRPRRQPRPGLDLTAELWFAPSLQYLPVRIVVRHDAETHVDLLLDRLPEQAEAGR